MHVRIFSRLPASVWLAVLWLKLSASLVAAQPQPASDRPATYSSASSSSEWPGQQPDGSMLLPNQWSLRPVGTQIELGDFPVNIAVHPDGRYAAILHAGYGKHEVVIIDLHHQQIISRTPIHETFYGLEFSSDGGQLFCSGAGDEVIHAFRFRRGTLTNHHEIRVRNRVETGVPAGLAVDHKAKRIFTVNVWGQRITQIETGKNTLPVDILLTTNMTSTSPAESPSDDDTQAADKRAAAALFETQSDDPFPYACRLDENRERLYVSLWGQAAIAVVDLKSNQVIARWPTEEHPCEMALAHSGKFLFVANANRNTVSLLDTDNGRVIETIWAAFFPQSPPGATPNSLALSPDERTLFVANANVNAIAVFDVGIPGKSRSLGFIPVGWYPTSVRVTPDGRHLLVANGKGVASQANPHGPQPGVKPDPQSIVEYIGGLFRGTLSVIELPAEKKFAEQMAAWTARAYQCVPLKSDAGISLPHPDDNPVPAAPGLASPIKYCIYVIKENRTYDQVFGDMPEGNGDAKLCLFPEKVTPNHHKLARQFVLLDNFYAESEVSADGHEWSLGAYASDFVEKMWPLNYGHAEYGKVPYPSEGTFPIAQPAGGYLWDRAAAASITYRSYGEFVINGKTTNDPARTKIKNLQGHFDEWFRSFDLGYSDLKRADRFIAELNRFETNGEMPRLQIVRLPNDHTHGSTKGFPTPTAYVAENDLALGRVIEAVSHSKYWPETAIFVVEDDAQNGPDHVDAHRTVALVISPYTRHDYVDSTMYSTTSLLRTMELILGLQPMSQFDAAAAPMFNSFQSGPDLKAYDALPANVDLNTKNGATAWGGNLRMNFAKEDAVDDLLLNEVIWRSVQGAEAPMPAPVRAAFVRAQATDHDED